MYEPIDLLIKPQRLDLIIRVVSNRQMIAVNLSWSRDHIGENIITRRIIVIRT